MDSEPVGKGGKGGKGKGGKGGGKGVSLLDGALAQADALMGKGPQAPAAPAATMGKGGKGGKGEAKADFRGPAGLFVAADWDCSVCGNTNWARRQTCNMCQSAKPGVVADAPREGLGGGFLEKQERASTAAVEVTEDGFDDFGRKRAAKPSDKAAKEAAALARLNASFGGSSGVLMNPAPGETPKSVEGDDFGRKNSAPLGAPFSAEEERRSRSGSPERKQPVRFDDNDRGGRDDRRRSRSRSRDRGRGRDDRGGRDIDRRERGDRGGRDDRRRSRSRSRDRGR